MAKADFKVYCMGWWDVYDLDNGYKVVNQDNKDSVAYYPKDDDPENWINKTDRVYLEKEEPQAVVTPISTTTGFKYLNESGLEEKVLLPSPCDTACVEIVNSVGQNVFIFTSDIPNLIATLKAAYEYEMGEKFE